MFKLAATKFLYLLIQIQAVDKLHWHLERPKSHHTLCPMYCWSRLLLDPH